MKQKLMVLANAESKPSSFKSLLLTKLISLFLTFSVVGQSQIMFKNYDVQNGLSHNYVRKVLQDSEGFIWIATEDGLNKFDGYTFQVFKNVPGKPLSIFKHPILDIVEDHHQNIWLATWGGGLLVYDRKLESFKSIKHQQEKPNGISSNYIYTLFKDSKGKVWVGTNGSGLDMIDPETLKVKSYKHNPSDPLSISNNRVMAITEDRRRNLWIGTIGGGVNRLDIETGTFEHYKHVEGDKKSLSHNEIYSIYFDSKERLWVGTWNSGLDLMEKEQNGFQHFIDNPADKNSIGNNQIWSITQDKEGTIWIGTDDGLAVFNDRDENFTVYQNDPFDPKSLASNSIKSIYSDNQNRLWIGTHNYGVCLFDKRYVQMGHFYRKQNENSLSHNNVSAFLEVGDGKILIGTDGGGLDLFNVRTNNFLNYKHDINNPESIGSNKIKALLLDSKKRVWISFWGAGIDLFDPNKKAFTHYRKGKSKHSLNNDNVTCLSEDKSGFLWLGTFGGGLSRFDFEKQIFTSFIQDINDPFSLGDNFIWSLLVDSRNYVWAGTSNGKLYYLDTDRKRFKQVELKAQNEEGYAIMALFEDAKGGIWIGLEGGGLKLLDRQNFSSKSFTQQDGLPSNNISAIEEDKNGNLWISTNQGIAKFDRVTGKFQNFHLGDGLQGLNFNRQASAALSSGELLFGGSNGFNFFHPDSLKAQNTRVPLVFTDFQIFNKPVIIGKENSPLKEHINRTSIVSLDYKQSVFSLEYAGLDYTAPETQKYKYRLKGFVDESWQRVGNNRRVTYTSLAPGNYTFEVSFDGKDQGEQTRRSLSIVITPPWWQTRFARLLIILISSSLLFLIYYVRSRTIHLQNRKLEKEVKERTIALTEANEALTELNKLIQEQKEEIEAQAYELVESNEEIKSINQQLEERVELRTADLKKSNQELDNFVYRVSHDIRAPLSSVLGLVSLIEGEENPKVIKDYLSMVTKSVNKLDGFVKDILDYSRNSRMEVIRKEIDFPELIRNTLEELQYMENADRVKIIPQLDIRFPHYSDSRRLHIILRNLLSNAIKYQNHRLDSSFLIIDILSDKEEAIFTVSDNGIGIDRSQVEKVFDMFYRGSDKSTGSGLGLYIVKEAIDKLNGTIQIESELGSGTTFKIKLPNNGLNY